MKGHGVLIRLGMVLFILLSFFPFFYTLLSSLKPAAQLFEFNPPFLAPELHLGKLPSHLPGPGFSG